MSYVSESYCLMIIASSKGTVWKTPNLSFASSWLSHFLHDFLAIYFLISLRDSPVDFFFLNTNFACCTKRRGWNVRKQKVVKSPKEDLRRDTSVDWEVLHTTETYLAHLRRNWLLLYPFNKYKNVLWKVSIPMFPSNQDGFALNSKNCCRWKGRFQKEKQKVNMKQHLWQDSSLRLQWPYILFFTRKGSMEKAWFLLFVGGLLWRRLCGGSSQRHFHAAPWSSCDQGASWLQDHGSQKGSEGNGLLEVSDHPA